MHTPESLHPFSRHKYGGSFLLSVHCPSQCQAIIQLFLFYKSKQIKISQWPNLGSPRWAETWPLPAFTTRPAVRWWLRLATTEGRLTCSSKIHSRICTISRCLIVIYIVTHLLRCTTNLTGYILGQVWGWRTRVFLQASRAHHCEGTGERQVQPLQGEVCNLGGQRSCLLQPEAGQTWDPGG